MKVLLPVKNDETAKFEMADGFHNISYVCIFDSNTRKQEWMNAGELLENQEDLSGALAERGIFSIISVSIPPMVLRLFNRNGIEVLKASGDNVEENIRLFQKSHLKIFSAEESRMIQSTCNTSSCSSCSSTCKS